MVTKIKCPKCEAVTDGAFCGMCGHRVQPPVISERNTEVSDFMPLAYVSAVPTLGSVFWMLGGEVFAPIARCSLWHLLVSSASILVRERLTAGSWVPTTKSAKILSIALAMQLLMALILVTVVYSRMIR